MQASENPSAPLFKSDLDQIKQHILALFLKAKDEYPGGLFEIRCIHPSDKNVKAQLFETTSHGFDKGAEWAATRNEGEGYNVYVGVNPRKPGTATDKAASGKDVEIAFFQFADIDSEESVRLLKTTRPLEYTFAVTTGRTPNPRPHVYWELETPTRNMKAWHDQQDAIAGHFKSDHVVDPPRIMRLAGSVNYPDAKKMERGYRTELVTIRTEYEDGEREPVTSEALHTAYPPLAKQVPATSGLNLSEYDGPKHDPRECLKNIANGHELHNNARDLINHMVGSGEPDWLIEQTVRTALGPVSDGGTLGEVDSLINSARRIFDVPPNELDSGESAQWGLIDLTALTAGRYNAPAFPVEVLGDFWGEWVSAHAEIASAPIDYVACSLLAAVGSLIGNARNVSPWAGWTEPSVIWVNLVGNPSSGKSPALDAPLSLMRKLEADLGSDYPDTVRQWEGQRESAKAKRSLWEGEVKTAVDKGTAPPDMPEDAADLDKPVMPRLSLSDATPEALGRLMAAHPKGLLFYRDELSGMLGGFDKYGGGGERAMWLEAFQARPYTIDRIKHGEPIRIPNFALSIVGGIQPDKLTTTLLAGEDDGLAARFLYCWPEPVPPMRPRRSVDDDAALDALRRLMNLRMGEDEFGNQFPITIRLSEDAAADLLQEFRDSNHIEGQEASGLYAGHIGKLPGIVARLSLVLAYLRWAPTDREEPAFIDTDMVGYAAHLVDAYFKPMSKRAFGDSALPEADRHAATICRRIVQGRHTEINASVIRRHWKLPGLRESGKVAAALRVLVETNCIRPNPSRSNGTSGRQKSDYEVNPELHEAAL